jgi:lactoylglutathione lyase
MGTKSLLVSLFAGLLLLTVAALPPGRPRPPLLGVAKITLRASDLDRSTTFYRDLLGFPEAGRRGLARRFRINQHQYVELRQGLNPGEDRMISVSLQTDQIETMRRYLGTHGWKVPRTVAVDAWGDQTFQVADPEGRWLEFVEYRSQGHGADLAVAKRLQSPHQISRRLMHAGIIATDVPSAFRFYGDILGLQEFWRGQGRESTYLSWINLRLPESQDYLELMLYGKEPPGDRRGSAHHLCLEVAEIETARQLLDANPGRAGYDRPLEIRVGVNRRRQLNLFDPDGTRSELMEPGTIDGVRPASSTAPYPPR